MPEESKLAEKLENQSKFSEEELKTVKEIQDEYVRMQNRFGQVSIAKIRVEEQLSAIEKTEKQLHESYQNLQNKEKDFLDGITKKYGEGTLNPDTGDFTPNK